MELWDPLFLGSGNSIPTPLRAVGRHSHPPLLSPLSSLPRRCANCRVPAQGRVAILASWLRVLSVDLEVGSLVMKPHWACRGALAPGKGSGSCPLILGLPRAPMRARAEDTIWIRYREQERGLGVGFYCTAHEAKGQASGPREAELS